MHAAIYAHLCKHLAPATALFDNYCAETNILSINSTQQHANCLVWKAKTSRFCVNGQVRDVRRALFEHYYQCTLERSDVVVQLCTSTRICGQPAHFYVRSRTDWRTRTLGCLRELSKPSTPISQDFYDPPTPASGIGSYGMLGSDTEDQNEAAMDIPCIEEC